MKHTNRNFLTYSQQLLDNEFLQADKNVFADTCREAVIQIYKWDIQEHDTLAPMEFTEHPSRLGVYYKYHKWPFNIVVSDDDLVNISEREAREILGVISDKFNTDIRELMNRGEKIKSIMVYTLLAPRMVLNPCTFERVIAFSTLFNYKKVDGSLVWV